MINMTVKQMQDNIISVFGFEHPNTEYFFKFCETFEIFEDIIKQEYNQILNTQKIVTNNYNCAHIHINICEGYTDDIIRVIVIEFKGKQFNSHIEIIKAIENIVLNNANDYINIIDIIIE
jgi:hypothetical protein